MTSIVTSHPKDRIPLLQKGAFSAGSCAHFLAVGMTISVLWMPFFNIGLGLSPSLLGIILMILRLTDAGSDLVIGYASDCLRTRWGRRRPFMVVGALLTAAIYPFLWNVPKGIDSLLLPYYLTGVGLLFFTCVSLWSIPYYSLLLELTPDYDERTRISAWLAFFAKITALFGGWFLAFIAGPWFADVATGESNLVRGMQQSSWGVAVLILIVGFLPPLFVRERYYSQTVSNKKRESFRKSVSESFQNKTLWQLIGTSAFLVLGSFSIGALGQYVNIYFVFNGEVASSSIVLAWKTTIVVTSGLIFIPVCTWLSALYDKRSIVIVMISASIVGHLLNIWCLRADMPYLQLIPALLEASALTAVWLFIPAMKADVADEDEASTGLRREGSLNSFYSLFYKISLTAAIGLSGFLLDLTGFDVHKPSQSMQVLASMKALFVLVPIVFWSVALILVFRFPLTREVMKKIRETLERRRGAV